MNRFMFQHLPLRCAAWGLAVLALSCAPWSSAQDMEDALAKRASWSSPSAEEVKSEIDALLDSQKADEAVRNKVNDAWTTGEKVELLDRLALALAAWNADAAKAVAAIKFDAPGGAPVAELAALADSSTPPLARNNLRLLAARNLLQRELVDEGLELIKELKPADVVDPASLLFYQAVGHHRLLAKKECLAALSQLLERQDELPQRYLTVAQLMAADIEPLKPDSLDEIARLMDDVRRRLDLARAGKKVRDQEDDVVAKLDKLIEELEKQQQEQEQQKQQQRQQQQQPQGGQQPSNPEGRNANDPLRESALPRLDSKGIVDPKDLGKKSGWGNLPPKDRQEVLQQIGRELPAHFRETIEDYFKRLARDGVK